MNKLNLGRQKEKDLESIKSSTLEMFERIEKMLEQSKVLLDSADQTDNKLAVELIENDQIIDDCEDDIIIEISNFMVTYQPVASDLRHVLGTFQIISDLERIGDNVKSFAKNMIKSDIDEKKHQRMIDKILELLLNRVVETKEAYDKTSHELAKSIARRDSEIDELTKNLISDINKKLAETEDMNEIKSFTRLILLAKFFERSGDHLANICEEISYIKKGQLYHYA